MAYVYISYCEETRRVAGGVDLQGCYAQRGEVCIRPAMWVDRTRLPHEEAPKRQASRRKSRGAADTPSSR